MRSAIEQLQARIERGGGDFAQLAGEFGLKPGEVARFERGAGGSPLGSDAGLNALVFGDAVLNQRRVGGPLQLGEDRLTIVQVKAHQAPAVQPLVQVRGAIVTALAHERGVAGAAQAAKAAVARLASGESFDKVSTDLKLKAEPARFIGRGEADLPIELREAAFNLAKPDKPQLQALSVEGGVAAVLMVTAVRSAPTSANAQLVALRAQRELQRYSLRDIEAYLNAAVKQAKVQKNLQVFQ
jgi:hypothetical protein